MKRKIFTLLFAAFAAGSAFAVATEDSVVLSTSFENVDDTLTMGKLVNQSNGHAAFATGAAHTGSGYLEVTITDALTNNWDAQYNIENIVATDFTRYRITLWAKTISGDPMNAGFVAGNYSFWPNINRLELKPGSEWQEYVMMACVDTAANLPNKNGATGPNQWRISIQSEKANTVMAFDDLKVEVANVGKIYAKGDSIVVDFGWKLDLLDAVDLANFTAKVDGSAAIIASGYQLLDTAGNLTKFFVLHLETAPTVGQAITLSFDGSSEQIFYGDATAPADLLAKSFTDESVENLVEPIAVPTVNSFAFQVYPNPTAKYLNVSYIAKSITVFDITGKMLKSVNNTNQVNVSSLAKGIYIINVDGASQKFVKE
jgi:hypothetical protein